MIHDPAVLFFENNLVYVLRSTFHFNFSWCDDGCRKNVSIPLSQFQIWPLYSVVAALSRQQWNLKISFWHWTRPSEKRLNFPSKPWPHNSYINFPKLSFSTFKVRRGGAATKYGKKCQNKLRSTATDRAMRTGRVKYASFQSRCLVASSASLWCKMRQKTFRPIFSMCNKGHA